MHIINSMRSHEKLVYNNSGNSLMFKDELMKARIDYNFINSVADYAFKDTPKDKVYSTRKISHFDRDYDRNVYAKNLASILQHSTNIDLQEIGEVLKKMHNGDRLLLLRQRTDLFKNFAEFYEVLSQYIDGKSRLLFVCDCIDYIYHRDLVICRRQILLTAARIPAHQQEIFFSFAAKYASDKNQHDLTSLLRLSIAHPHINKLSASLLLSSISFLNQLFGGYTIVSTVSGLAAMVVGIKGLNDVLKESTKIPHYTQFFWQTTEQILRQTMEETNDDDCIPTP